MTAFEHHIYDLPEVEDVEDGEYYISVDLSDTKFARYSNNRLYFNPQEEDIGFYIIPITLSNKFYETIANQYILLVTVTPTEIPITSEPTVIAPSTIYLWFNSFIVSDNLVTTISEITKWGEVTIEFNQELNIPENYKSFDKESI